VARTLPLRCGFLSLLMLASCASAATTFRCDTQGKVTYSDVACDGALALPAADLRAPATIKAEQDEALRQAAANKVQVQRLEAARNKVEHAERKERLHASAIASARQRKCETLAQRRKWANEDASAASGRHAEKASRKARRVAEQYELECKA
jgi:response regulator RpfG family c-di-GMP phosphodiesterase